MDNLLTTMQAAQYAGVSSATIRIWAKHGYLGKVDMNVSTGAGCGYKIQESALEEYLAYKVRPKKRTENKIC